MLNQFFRIWRTDVDILSLEHDSLADSTTELDALH